MRIIKSEGKVNIFNLAKNAGTSVDQIECTQLATLEGDDEKLADVCGLAACEITFGKRGFSLLFTSHPVGSNDC